MHDISLSFKGVGIHRRSTGTNLILQYCIDHNLKIPAWLEPQMTAWPRFIQLPEDGLLHDLYDSEVKIKKTENFVNIFSSQILFIINELKGNWTYIVSGKYDQHYAFELEEDAMIFKLRWL